MAAAGFAVLSCNHRHHHKRIPYHWDGDVVCSRGVDDKDGSLRWTQIEQDMADAEQYGWAVLYHAHTPGDSVTRATIEHLFDLADKHHLQYATFRELAPWAPPRAVIAFALDDSHVDAWMTIRDIVRAHHARITLFVSEWYALGDQQLAELGELAADGDDIEPHTVHHVYAPEYVRHHGLGAYVLDEVLPSFAPIVAAGYPKPAAFAYPFGDHTPELDGAVIGATGVNTVRTNTRECPCED